MNTRKEPSITVRFSKVRTALAGIIGLALSSYSLAQVSTTPSFKINEVFVSNGNNMHFRVYGMPSMSYCGGMNWAYIGESDSGEKGKVAALLSAYTAGKQVTLNVEPVDFYSNGINFCHIIEVDMQG